MNSSSERGPSAPVRLPRIINAQAIPAGRIPSPRWLTERPDRGVA